MPRNLPPPGKYCACCLTKFEEFLVRARREKGGSLVMLTLCRNCAHASKGGKVCPHFVERQSGVAILDAFLRTPSGEVPWE